MSSLLVGLLGLLGDGGGDSVHVGAALLGQGLAEHDVATLVRHVLGKADKTGSLELDHAVADVLASSLAVVLGAGAVALVAAVVLAEGVDAEVLVHVQLVGNGGSSGVEPVVIIGSEFPSAGGLAVLGPLY